MSSLLRMPNRNNICSKGAAEKIHLKMKAQCCPHFWPACAVTANMEISEETFPRDCPHEPPRPPANRQSSRVNPHGKNTLRGHMWTHWLAKENQTYKCLEPSVCCHCSSMFRTWWWFIFQRWDLQCWIVKESVKGFLNLTALGVMLLFLEITYFNTKRRFFGTKL